MYSQFMMDGQKNIKLCNSVSERVRNFKFYAVLFSNRPVLLSIHRRTEGQRKWTILIHSAEC